LDPLYVDVAVRRWEQMTDISAKHAKTDRTFSETAAKRAIDETNSCQPRPPHRAEI
jgi:hypothetical protein